MSTKTEQATFVKEGSTVELEQQLEQLNKVREELESKAEEAILRSIGSLFKAVPTLQAISWTQTTPYFNDGDVCEFSVDEPQYCFKQLDGDVDDFDIDEAVNSEDWIDEYELDDELEPLFADFKLDEELCKIAFGNDMQILVTRQGIVSTTDYSDHD